GARRSRRGMERGGAGVARRRPRVSAAVPDLRRLVARHHLAVRTRLGLRPPRVPVLELAAAAARLPGGAREGARSFRRGRPGKTLRRRIDMRKILPAILSLLVAASAAVAQESSIQ